MGEQQNKHAIFLLCCCIQLVSASAFGSTSRNESHEEVKSSGKPDDIYFADFSSFYASPRFMEGDEDLHGTGKPWGKVLGGTVLINMITLVGVVFLVPAFSKRMMHKISAAFFWRADKEAHAHIIHVCTEEQEGEDGDYVEGHSKMLDIFIPSFAAGALFATVVFLVIPESIMLLNSGVATHEDDHAGEEAVDEDHDEELAELATGAIWRFGTGILSGFLLPVVLGAVFPRSVEHECNEDCGPSELNDLMSKCMIKTDDCHACAKMEQGERGADADVENLNHVSYDSNVAGNTDETPAVSNVTLNSHDHDHSHSHSHDHGELEKANNDDKTPASTCHGTSCPNDHKEVNNNDASAPSNINSCHESPSSHNHKESNMLLDAQDSTVEQTPRRSPKPLNYALAASILIGDGFHNFCDGIFVGVAFMLCSNATAFTIVGITVYHEIAQELADFFLLTKHAGLRVTTALAVNFIAGLSVVLGGIVVLSMEVSDLSIGVILSIAAGVYINIAASECVPRVSAVVSCATDRMIAVFAFIVGAVPVGLSLLNHEHCEAEPH